MRAHARLSAAVLLACAGAACSGDGTAPPPAGSPSASVSPGTPAAQTNVRSGTGSATVSGEEDFRVEIALAPADSQFNDPPAGFAFVFKDDDDNLITIGGESFQGTRQTAGTLALGLVFNRDGRVIAHTDTSGGCRITMNRSGKTVTGSFLCEQVEDGRYRVEGTFTAELA